MPARSDVKGDYIEQKLSAWDEEYEDLNFAFRVYGWYDFPRGKNGNCAFCDGDPCAENGEGLIAIYREGRGKKFENCPVCKGFPS